MLAYLLVEGAETVELLLGNLTGTQGALGAQTTHTATITDDDQATVAFQAATSATADEGAGNHTVEVVLSVPAGTTPTDVTVEVSDAGSGTASSGGDYSAVGTVTLTFPAGSANGATQVFNLGVLADLLVEGDETVDLQLGNATGIGGALGVQTTHTATITDDDQATVAFVAATSATVDEGAGNHTMEVVLSVPSSTTLTDITVDVTDAGSGSASSGTDYSAVGVVTLTFPAGSVDGASQTFDLVVLDDLLVEGNETADLQLGNVTGIGGALGAQTTHSATITDDDQATVAFVLATSVTADEATGNHGVEVVLSLPAGTTPSDITVDVTDAGSGSASSGADYSAVGVATLTFPTGSPDGATQVFNLAVLNDALIEGNETVDVLLGNPTGTGGVLGAQVTHTATITDDDPSQLVFSAQPLDALATVAIAPAIRVQVLDSNGLLVATATNSVTLAIDANAGGGTLAGTLTVAAVAGEATFADISIDKAGSGYTLRASATGLTVASSTAFSIVVGPRTQLGFSVEPSNTQAAVAISPAIKVQVQDAGGNLIPTATDSIALSIGTNPSAGALVGTLTLAAIAGEATFDDISIDQPGTGYSLTAASGILASASSKLFDITVNLATKIDTATSEIQTGIVGIQTTVGSIQTTVGIIQQDTAEIKQDTAEIKQDTTEIKVATQVTIPGKIESLQSGVTAILEDTSSTIPQALSSLQSEVKAGLRAKILNRPTTVKAGSTTPIQFQSESGLSPVVTVYDSEGLRRVIELPMTEIDDTGVYTLDLTIEEDWPLGDYTVMVTEPVNGSLESISLEVSETDIPTIGADIAELQGAVSGTTGLASQAASAARAASAVIEEVRKELGGEGQSETAYELIAQMRTALDKVKEAIAAIPGSLENSPMNTTIREMSQLLKQLSSENGVNLDLMYESIDETTSDVNEVQDKVERLRVLMELNQEIAEKLLERAPPKKAIIKTWFESG